MDNLLCWTVIKFPCDIRLIRLNHFFSKLLFVPLEDMKDDDISRMSNVRIVQNSKFLWMCALIIKSQMPHGISSQSFFIRLVSSLSILEWQNRTLSIFPFFHYFVKTPLAKSKCNLKIHPYVLVSHSFSWNPLTRSNRHE